MVQLIRLPQQQRRRAMGREVLVGEEVGIACGDDRIGDEEAGVAVVGVESVATPRVVAEHHVGPDRANPSGDISLLPAAVVELSVGATEETTPLHRREARRLALLVLAQRQRVCRPRPDWGPSSPSTRR